MKIAVIGDVHAHNWKEFSREVEVTWEDNRYKEVQTGGLMFMNNRLLNTLSALCDVRDYCQQNGIHHILFCGDMFHARKNVDISVMMPVFQILDTFQRANLNMYMIAGNHDQIDNSEFPISSLHAFRYGEFIRIYESPSRESLSASHDLLALPYCSNPSRIKEAIEASTSKILLAHAGISGAKTGSSNFIMKDTLSLADLQPEKFQYVILGHYHKPQFLAPNVFYAGSLLQNNFNDEGDKHGFWVINLNRRYDIQMIPLDYPKFITVNEENMTSISPKVLEGNYVRVIASEKRSAEIAEKVQTMMGDDTNIKVNVEKDYKPVDRSKISISMTDEQIIRQYVNESGSDLNKDTLVELGAEIIKETQKV